MRTNKGQFGKFVYMQYSGKFINICDQVCESFIVLLPLFGWLMRVSNNRLCDLVIQERMLFWCAKDVKGYFWNVCWSSRLHGSIDIIIYICYGFLLM